MIDKDDFEDFLLMQGKFDKPIEKEDEETIRTPFIINLLAILWFIFLVKCC